MSKSISWHTLCVQADPDHTRDARVVVEYEMSAPARLPNSEEFHQGGRRVFLGDYQSRGPYGEGSVGVRASGGVQMRSTSWYALCTRVDPEFVKNNTIDRIEYEFSGNFGGDERTHDGQWRIFKGNDAERGPYIPEEVDDDGLTWNGIPLSWEGEPLTWDD